MTFTEWYKKTHNVDWHEDFGLLYGYASIMLETYESWCKEKGIKPVYDG